jgi:hypothetical protein
VTWVFGVFAVFAFSTAIWPQDPGDVPIGAVLGTTAAAVAVAAGVRSHRRSRFADDVVRVLSTETPVNPFAAEDLATSLSGDSPVRVILHRIHEQSRALAVMMPVLADLVPDLPAAAHSAELALIALCRRVTAHEIDAANREGAVDAFEQSPVPEHKSEMRAASDALSQGVAEYESLVWAAAKASTRLNTVACPPADEIRSAAEEVEFLAIGLAEIALINDKYELRLADIDRLVSGTPTDNDP